jgi:hypothetical protein
MPAFSRRLAGIEFANGRDWYSFEGDMVFS